MKNSSNAYLAPGELLDPVLGLMESDGEAALSSLADLIGRYPDDARLYFMSGSVLAGLERYADGLAAMRTAVDLAPDFAIARFQLGFLMLTSGDPTGAQSVWSPLHALPSDHPLRLFVEGLDAMVADRFEEAVASLEAGIERNQVLPPLNNNMRILIQEIREKFGAQGSKNDEVESGAHFLLKQYSFKNTQH